MASDQYFSFNRKISLDRIMNTIRPSGQMKMVDQVGLAKHNIQLVKNKNKSDLAKLETSVNEAMKNTDMNKSFSDYSSLFPGVYV